MTRSEWMVRLLHCYKGTVDLLDAIRSQTPYACIELTALDLADYKAHPTWLRGRAEIGYNNEPEAIAHELGHGLHEAIRDAGWADEYGEDFAEATRYYVERQLQTQSQWLASFDRTTNTFTQHYANRADFIQALNSGQIFTDIGWSSSP